MVVFQLSDIPSDVSAFSGSTTLLYFITDHFREKMGRRETEEMTLTHRERERERGGGRGRLRTRGFTPAFPFSIWSMCCFSTTITCAINEGNVSSSFYFFYRFVFSFIFIRKTSDHFLFFSLLRGCFFSAPFLVLSHKIRLILQLNIR